MRALALDLATRTGWAHNVSGELMAGVWTLGTPKEIREWGASRMTRRRDPRILRLRDLVSPFCGVVDCIVMEDILFASSVFQITLWSSLRAAAWLACQECGIVFEAVPVQTLKIFATGKGNADKPAMCAAVAKWDPDRFSILRGKLWDSKQNLFLTDDAADAIHLWRWSQQHIRIK